MMAMTEDLEKIRAQEAGLQFTEFSEETAFAIGTAIRDRAVAEKLPIVIDIRLWDRPLFYAALPGSSGIHPDWARRKSNVVQRWGKSSYRVLFETKGERLLGANWGLDPSEYALSGGGFPIRAKGFGVIGAVTLSGLSERRDHMVGVEAICDRLGLAKEAFALADGITGGHT